MLDVAAALLEVLRGSRRGALATVVRTSGSTPQAAGARLLLRPDGRSVGTVGGGAIEKRVLEALKRCLEGEPAHLVEHDLGGDLAMCCGGRMAVFIEPIVPQERLFICGAGHVAKPTAALARSVGFRVTVIDDREELLTAERFPECQLELDEPPQALTQLDLVDGDWVLIVTHDHHLDERTLETAASLPHRYVGLIGSRRKVFRILQRLQARVGLPPLAKVYAPVGLDLGAETPEEIAVSIVGELVALRRGRTQGHMRAIDHPKLQQLLSTDPSLADARETETER